MNSMDWRVSLHSRFGYERAVVGDTIHFRRDGKRNPPEIILIAVWRGLRLANWISAWAEP
jgi:hypothetical protein